jgi:hypothetical protein
MWDPDEPRYAQVSREMAGYWIIEVSVSHHPWKFGKSKYHIRNRMVRSFIDLLAVKWMKHRTIRYDIAEKI